MGMISNIIAKNIVKFRKSIPMTQKEFAKRLGVTQSRVSNWEHGTNSPDIEMLFKICKIFNISIDEIYSVDEDETEYKIMKSIQYLEDAGFEVFQDEKDAERNEYQICHPDFGTITVIQQQDLINLLDKILKDSTEYQERYIIDRLKTEFLPKNK